MTTTQVKRRIPRRAALLAGVIAVLMFAGANTFAFHVGDALIELEGNIVNDGAAVEGDLDWIDIFGADGLEKAGLPASILDTTGVIRDYVPGASGPDDSYHEPSNKDAQAINAAGGSGVWGCRSVANATDKDDILNAYAMASLGVGEDAGDLILHFGAERYDNSGSAYIGVWFFQADVTCDLATNKFTGTKTNNDILALVNFSNGGSNISIQAFAWHPAASNPTTAAGTFELIGQGVNCLLSSDNDGDPTHGDGGLDLCAEVNVTNDVTVPWGAEDKPKSGDNNLNELEPAEFIEGGINLTDAFAAAGHTAPTCFGSFMAETRSSDTLSATLKDFALHDLDTCDANITINPSATNRVGENHTFTVHVNQIVNGVPVLATVGNVDVTLTSSNGANAVINTALSTCDDAQPTGDNLNASGECIVVFSSATSGTVVGNATVSIPLGTTTLVRDTDPATTLVGSGPGGSGPATKKFVDAKISIAADATNRVGGTHTFTVTVQQDTSADGGFIAASGVTVTGSILNSNGATSVFSGGTNTCVTGAAGTCQLTITGPMTGIATVSASAPVTVETKLINVTTNSLLGSSGPAVKKWVDARISIGTNGTNRVGQPHTFTVTVTRDDSAAGAFVGVQGITVTGAITQSGGSTATFVGGSTCVTGTAGTCDLTVTSPTTGTATVNASATVIADGLSINVLTNGLLGSSGPATKTWVDARIAIAGTDTDGITEEHTFTVTVTKDLGTGTFVAAVGEDVNVTLTSAGGAVYVLDTSKTTCDVVGAGQTFVHTNPDTGAGGTCVVVFTSGTAGTVTGTASSSLTVSGVAITVTTNGANGNSGSVVKTFVSGSLIWHKNDNHGVRLLGATFEICRLDHINTAENPDAYVNDNPDVCFTIRDNDATDEDPTAGNFLVSGLVLGHYTARETIAPAGYHIDNPAAVPFDDPMTTADPNIEIATPFTNSKAFRMIIYTCDDITHTLVASAVDLDGNPLTTGDRTTTITAAQFALLGWKDALGNPLTQAAFCSATLPGANYGPLDEGTYRPSVKIPE